MSCSIPFYKIVIMCRCCPPNFVRRIEKNRIQKMMTLYTIYQGIYLLQFLVAVRLKISTSLLIQFYFENMRNSLTNEIYQIQHIDFNRTFLIVLFSRTIVQFVKSLCHSFFFQFSITSPFLLLLNVPKFRFYIQIKKKIEESNYL